jgi:hypothetical protein
MVVELRVVASFTHDEGLIFSIPGFFPGRKEQLSMFTTIANLVEFSTEQYFMSLYLFLPNPVPTHPQCKESMGAGS